MRVPAAVADSAPELVGVVVRDPEVLVELDAVAVGDNVPRVPEADADVSAESVKVGLVEADIVDVPVDVADGVEHAEIVEEDETVIELDEVALGVDV